MITKLDCKLTVNCPFLEARYVVETVVQKSRKQAICSLKWLHSFGAVFSGGVAILREEARLFCIITPVKQTAFTCIKCFIYCGSLTRLIATSRTWCRATITANVSAAASATTISTSFTILMRFVLR